MPHATPSRTGPLFSRCEPDNREIHSFPTRRSSDLRIGVQRGDERCQLPLFPTGVVDETNAPIRRAGGATDRIGPGDRKSTRLNSSHSQISYAVFCLQKKISNDLESHTCLTATTLRR